MRDWFWQIQAAQQGPDWYFFATFIPTDAERLAAWVRQQPLPGFSRCQVNQGPLARQPPGPTCDLYVDQGNHARLVANLEESRPQNIWIFHTIEICGPDLTITRGYGGYPSAHGATETELIVALAQMSELTWVDWKVVYGGEGYPAVHLATGTTNIELLAYLRGVALVRGPVR